MTGEAEPQILQKESAKPFSHDIKLIPTNAFLVNSKFILQVHFEHKRPEVTYTKLGIFAPAEIPIIRDTAKNKRPKSNYCPQPGRVTFLSLSMNDTHQNVSIEQIKISLIRKGGSTLTVKIKSPTPLQAERINHHLDERNTAEAQNILNPTFNPKLDSEMNEEITARAKFEVERALTNYQAGRATQTEITFLRRRRLI